jgi:hypothetical protein
MHRGVYVRDEDGLRDVVDERVMADVCLRGARKSEDRGSETAGDDGGKSKLLHDVSSLHIERVRTGPSCRDSDALPAIDLRAGL